MGLCFYQSHDWLANPSSVFPEIFSHASSTSHLSMQSAAVITRSNMIWYYTQHRSDSDRKPDIKRTKYIPDKLIYYSIQ